ncbi:MAG: EAL domain-containing protein [Alphaproteobacteria bacterium]|nr:EAL domain-containing protein [Alphaproteobacteria bacterium]OJV14203.1 MAG: hypothetical protein BGO27_01735 [Alphaproteobacteria bacterium 33-17]
MDKKINPKTYHTITDFYASRILDIIDQNIKFNKRSCYFLVEIKNFNNLLFLYGNQDTYKMVENLGVAIQTDSLRVEVINHNHYLCIINEYKDDKEILSIAYEIFAKMHEFGFNKNNAHFYFHSVIGFYHTNYEDNQYSQDVINKCIIALDHAKNSQENFCSFKQVLAIRQELQKEIQQANFVHKSLHFKNYSLAFQPIVDSITGDIHYYEALLRLKNDKGELISIGPYITTAEKYGFINLIDNISMEMTIDMLYKHSELCMGFNISSLSFESEAAFENILSYLNLHQKVLPRLIVEITETSVIKNLGKAAMFVAQLQNLGCRVAIDDFGAGYTSFRQIKALSADYVKIDGSFIKDLASASDNVILVSAFIDMCHKLGIKTIAEYVENGNITKTLIELGCNYLQGNYFAPAQSGIPIELNMNNQDK